MRRRAVLMLARMNDRSIAIAAKKIAVEMRRRVEIVSEYLGTIETLAGLCHFAALGVTQAMCSAGLPAFIASDGGHSWTEVELSTGLMLVDVTASQFGFADVLIRMPGQPRPKRDRIPPDERDRQSRRRFARYRRDMYVTRVTGLQAQRMASGVAAEVIQDEPPDWWMLPVEHLADVLRLAGTTFGPYGSSLHKRVALAAE